MQKYKLLMWAGVCIAALGLMWFVRNGLQATSSHTLPVVATMQVEQGMTETDIMAEGTTVVHNIANVVVQPGFTGRVKSVLVDVGDHVTVGQPLAELDADDEKTKLDKSLAALVAAQQSQKLVLVPHRPEEIQQMQMRLASDQQAISQVEQKLNILQTGALPQELLRSAAAVTSAKAKMTQLQAEYDRNQILCSKDLIPRADLEQSATDLTVARAALTEALQSQSLLKQGPRPQEIEIAREALQQAKLTEQDHQAAYRMLLEGSRPEEIQTAAAHLDEARSDVSNQEIIYDHRWVKSPIAGVVTARNINPGEVAAPGSARSSTSMPQLKDMQGLFVIADNSSLEFMASVDQLYYRSMQVGQQVAIGLEAMPGRSYPGRISRIAPLIDAGGRQTGTSPLTFTVWAKIIGSPSQIVPGQTGVLRLTRRQTGLVIPQSALTSFTLGEGIVYVEKDGYAHARSIKYEDNSDGEVRLLSGLSSGDKVIISPAANLTDGMAVRSVPASSQAQSTAAN